MPRSTNCLTLMCDRVALHVGASPVGLTETYWMVSFSSLKSHDCGSC